MNTALQKYRERKQANLNRALPLIKHPYSINPKDKFSLIIECSESDLDFYCAYLGCSGFYSKINNRAVILNFFEYGNC